MSVYFEKYGNDKIDLELLNKDYSIKLERKLKEIDKKTKSVIVFNIKIVDKLILSKRGKFKMFISVKYYFI